MTWAKWIFAYLFDCVHRHTTWPQRARTGIDYVCCLDCGKEFAYSTQLMCIVSKEDRLKDRSQYLWGRRGRWIARRAHNMCRALLDSIDTKVPPIPSSNCATKVVLA
jgi:hypothetical protein